MGMMIESLVAILLMLTVGYCMLLNRRLKLLKAEKEHTRRGDELALMRHQLPWVRIDKDIDSRL